MVETLTESFCERCGTRYEFRAPTRLNPLRKTRGFIGGLRNYLTSQDALSDAMGDAMRTEEDQLAAAQLDAFHESFNFCIGCRQYTCLNCWNDDAGRCRTCAPIAGTDDLTERLLAVQPGAAAAPSAALAEAEPTLAGDEISRRLGLDGWTGDDAGAVPIPTNGDAAHAWPETDPLGAAAVVASDHEPVVEDEVEAEPEPELTLEPVVAEEAQPWVEAQPEALPEPEPDAVAEPEHWPVAAEIEPEIEPVAASVEDQEPAAPFLRVVAWEADSAYEVEPEPVVEPELAVEPMLAAEIEPEPLVSDTAPEPEVQISETVPELEPEPQPIHQVSPISETIVRFPDRPAAPEADQPVVAAEADSPELAARRAQLDLLGLGDPGEGPALPERPAVLPYRSRGAAVTPVELAMRAGGGFWEASAREVASAGAAQVGVQNCGECGLSLSATARFCRRCGTSQARSA